MTDLERRLRRGRPPLPMPSAEAERRALRAIRAGAPGRSPGSWLRSPRGRRGRLLTVAVLLAAGAGAALAAEFLDRDAASQPTGAPVPDLAWGRPQVLSLPSSATLEPDVALDRAGGALIAWSRAGRIEARRRPSGGRWAPAAILSPPRASAGPPAVAVAPTGDAAMVVWRERRGVRTIRRVLRLPGGEIAGVATRRIGGRYVLVGRRWSAGGGWTRPEALSPAARNGRDIAEPRIVAVGDGFVLAWNRAGRVEARDISATGVPGPVVAVAERTTGEPQDLALVSDGEAALLTWALRTEAIGPSGYAAPSFSVVAAERRAGVWGPTATLSRSAGGDKPRPVAAVGAGEAIVAWSGGPRPPNGIYTARRTGAIGWETPVRLSSPARSAFSPSVAIDGEGVAVAHWSVGAATQFAVARRGGAWTAPRSRGSSGLTRDFAQAPPALVADGGGGLLAAFGERPGAHVRAWRPGGPFGRARRVLADTGWQYGFDGLAAAPDGTGVLVTSLFGRSSGVVRRPWRVGVVVREPVRDRAGEIPR